MFWISESSIDLHLIHIFGLISFLFIFLQGSSIDLHLTHIFGLISFLFNFPSGIKHWSSSYSYLRIDFIPLHIPSGIKHWSSSYSYLRIDFIPLQFLFRDQAFISWKKSETKEQTKGKVREKLNTKEEFELKRKMRGKNWKKKRRSGLGMKREKENYKKGLLKE